MAQINGRVAVPSTQVFINGRGLLSIKQVDDDLGPATIELDERSARELVEQAQALIDDGAIDEVPSDEG